MDADPRPMFPTTWPDRIAMAICYAIVYVPLGILIGVLAGSIRI